MQPIKGSQVLMFVGALVIVAAIGLSFIKVFQATPPAAPELSRVLSEPKTIGVLTVSQYGDVVVGLKEGLKELGYTNVTFKEVLFETKATEQDVANLAKELIAEKVDLLYVPGEFWALWIINATKTIGNSTPIVHFSNFHDPVAYGLAKSFLSSGNNATGVSMNIAEVIQKQLEFLRKLRPDSKKIGVFGKGFGIPFIVGEWLNALKQQAPRLDYEVVEYTTDVSPPNVESAFHDLIAKFKRGDVDALYHIGGHYYGDQQTAETELAERLQIPMIVPLEDLPTGGHFGYSADFLSSGKQTAKMVDKIFRGAKPSNIPLEHAEKIFLVVYPTRARQAGVEFPEFILSIATQIVNDK